jgi:hypothetical protein
MINVITIFFTVAIFTSCAVSEKKLSKDGLKIRVLSQKSETDCNVIERVIGKNENGSDELAKNHAKNLAASIDGNAIFFNDMVSNGNAIEAHATVYNCK